MARTCIGGFSEDKNTPFNEMDVSRVPVPQDSADIDMDVETRGQAVTRLASPGSQKVRQSLFPRTRKPRAVADVVDISWNFETGIETGAEAGHIRGQLIEALVREGCSVGSNVPDVVVDIVPASRYGATYDDLVLVLGRYAGEHDNPVPIGIVCTSGFTARTIIDNGAKLPVTVIGLGIDDWLQTVAERHDILSGRNFRFLCVVGEDDSIDLRGLLQSFAYVFDEQSDVTLIIAAPVARIPDLSEMSKKSFEGLEAPPHVTFVSGDVEPEALKIVYEQCDVLVSPHRSCGFNLPIARAFICGLPVMATAWGGHRSYCDDANSWSIDYRFRRAERGGIHSGAVEADPMAFSMDALLLEASKLSRADLAKRASHGHRRLVSKFTWSNFARQLGAFAEKCLSVPPVRMVPRTGWLTTWNTRCGIADHSSYMVDAAGHDTVTIYAPREQPLLADPSFCTRLWNVSKEDNDFGILQQDLAQTGVKALIIQFNYGFFNHQQLAALIDHCAAQNIVTIVEFHSTVDPKNGAANFNLREMTPALRECQRLIVHGIADLERLKKLGLTDNAMILPMGTLKLPRQPKTVSAMRIPVISTYGFCLPNKGLPEVIEAVALLRARGRDIRLRMLNAEHPDPISAREIELVKQTIAKHDLGDRVEFNWRYLDAAVSMQRLSEADLIVNSYQFTGESASAGVRTAISAGVPVAVTPLAIFDDLGDVVFRLPGISPQHIADGIENVLDHIAGQTEVAATVQRAAEEWIDQHDYRAAGTRMQVITQSLISHPLPF